MALFVVLAVTQMRQQILSVLYKDIRSELRSRDALYAILLFITNSTILILLATAGTALSAELFSGLFWLILLFSSVVGMGKSFVSEEERGTALYLRLIVESGHLLTGKILYNFLLSVVLSTTGGVLFLVVFEIGVVADMFAFALCILGACIGMSVVTTFSAALISRSAHKSAVLPVVSFPLLLPLILLGIDTTTMSVAGAPLRAVMPGIIVMISYSTVVYLVSLLLFPFVWRD